MLRKSKLVTALKYFKKTFYGALYYHFETDGHIKNGQTKSINLYNHKNGKVPKFLNVEIGKQFFLISLYLIFML